MKVYIVQLDWDADDSADVELYVYDSYDKARKKFKELIANELNPELSWVGELDWENGKPVGNYSLWSKDSSDKEQVLYWHILDNWNGKYSYINLYIMGVM